MKPAVTNAARAWLLAILLPVAGALGAQEEPLDEEPAVLDTVEVSGEREIVTPYHVNQADTLKDGASLMETPQSISVITSEALRDRGAQTLQDALRYSAGVMPDAYGLDNRGDWAVIRGAEFQPLVDGMREEFTYYSVARPDPYTLESVEILRGPASVLYGQGPVAGVVNVVSKRPQPVAAHEIVTDYGSFNRREVAGDFTGPLTSDGSLLYRVVGMHRESDSQVDFAYFDRQLLMPSLTWRPSGSLSWTMLAHYQSDASANAISFLPHSGTVEPNPNGRIPIERFTSEPGYDRYDVERRAVTSFVDWQFAPDWGLHQRLRISDNDNPYRSLYPDVFSNPDDPFIDAQDRVVERSAWTRLSQARAVTADQSLRGRIALGGLEHRVMVGVDAADARNRERSGFLAAAGPLDLFAPEYGTFTEPTLGPESTTRSRFYGVYAQDQVDIGERWSGVLGLRYDDARVEPEGAAAARDHATTARAGILYRASARLAPYVSYSESFLPNTATDAQGEVFEPRRGEQAEAGIKIQPADGALITVAAFDLKERNFVVFDPGLSQNVLAEVDARGVELEAAGRLAAVDLTAAYTYTDAERREYYAVQPRHLASLWGKYRVGNLSCGLGVRYVGVTTSESGRLEVPSATLLDVMLAYQWREFEFALNGTNVTDEAYLTSCLDRGDCFYGNRGSVVGTLGYRF
jgi:iron complex outermembrane receptor protein